MVKTPRIVLDDVPDRSDSLVRRQTARFGLAVLLVGIAGALGMVLGSTIPRASYMAFLFVAVLCSAVIGGLFPGLLATVLSLLVGSVIPEAPLAAPQLMALAIQGVLVSVVGETLRRARHEARERLKANLRLERQIVEIGDDQRQRIGHDLHDGLGQHLTGISLLSETIAQQMESGKLPERTHVETITRLVSEAVGITRDLAKSLSPVTLEQEGLVAAISELAETTETLLGVKCSWEGGGASLSLDRSRSLHLYRIIQEAVNNSVRHGKARTIRIDAQQNGKDVTITVLDDGSGLSERTIHNPGLGLRIMQYRARMLGATLTVERAGEAGGTRVICTCPLGR